MGKKSTIVHNSFNAGEWSPKLDGRVDLDKYYSACRTLQNCLVYPQGGAFRRPGLEYIAGVPNNANITRLIPFVYSDTDAYILEFSDLLIRFYRTVSGVPGLILDDDAVTITSIVSPYESGDLAELEYYQNGDALYLTHPDFKPRRLVRTDHNTWTISAPDFADGPFLPENTGTTDLMILTYEIDAVTSGAGGKFRITNALGNLTAMFDVGSTFRVVNSTVGNNGDWTVASRTWSSPNFDINVAAGETVIADGTHSGQIRPDINKGSTVHLYLSATPTGPGDFTGFEAGHVGALFQMRLASRSEEVSGSFASATSSSTLTVGKDEQVLFVTHGTWKATISLQISYDAGVTYTDWSGPYAFNYDGNVEVRKTNTLQDDALVRATVSSYESGTVWYNLVSESYLKPGVAEITSIIDSRTAIADIKTTMAEGSYVTKKWSEGAWSTKRGYPTAVTFFEQRAFYGGTTYEPTTIWGSVSLPGGDYENFLAGVDDDASLTFTLAQAQDPIKWLASGKRLIIGTSGGPYTIGGISANTPLTPTNVQAESHGVEGSAAITAVKTAIGHLYVDRSARKVNELAYNWERDQLVTVDMTRLADHISAGGITEIALQLRPEPILWCITGDGNLIGLTYLREEDVVCWHRHVTDGSFESVAVIPGAEEDEVWFVVNRTISGTKRFVERMKEWDWGDDQEDMFFVDSGLAYDGAATDTIDSGLDHLEGETVSVLADGEIHADCVVTSGEITLDAEYSVVQVGLPYTSTIKPMKIPKGTLLQGSSKRIAKMALNFYKTGYAEIGSAAADMQSVTFSTAPTIYSGVMELDFPGGYEEEGTLIIESDQPTAMTILSYAALVEAE